VGNSKTLNLDMGLGEVQTVLWNRRYDLLRFRFGLWISVGSGSGSRHYLAQFSNNKKFEQNLAFTMPEATL
jgi:hypothetical protein